MMRRERRSGGTLVEVGHAELKLGNALARTVAAKRIFMLYLGSNGGATRWSM
jgi:hypothetical protein